MDALEEKYNRVQQDYDNAAKRFGEDPTKLPSGDFFALVSVRLFLPSFLPLLHTTQSALQPSVYSILPYPFHRCRPAGLSSRNLPATGNQESCTSYAHVHRSSFENVCHGTSCHWRCRSVVEVHGGRAVRTHFSWGLSSIPAFLA